MWFSKYKKTDFSGGDLHKDPEPLMESRAFYASPQFVAPRRMDSRDMCLRSSNQGQTPHCAGYSTAGFIEVFNWRTKHYPEQCDGDLIYTEAKKLDGMPQVNGTILRCAGQGAINAGLIKGVVKQVPKTEMDIQFAIHTYGVCVAGFMITDEWNLVEKTTGKISNFGDKARIIGGHALLLAGYSDEGIYIQNSWGEEWGIYGFGILSWEQFNKQIMDAMVIVPEVWTPENSVRAA